ncbi:hypothetical protein [Fluviispira vulneris]|uniref:hypothetical protein n=1 Tax=Fluviispira vulneris TaxID=2763012 RepID=UPI0016459220|nr:hypothetical protein [Fluviispira vulneris]
MFIFKYYNNYKKGILKKELNPSEVRNIIKSNFTYYESTEFSSQNDSFNSIKLNAMYNKNNELFNFGISEHNYWFDYNGFNLFCSYEKLLEHLKIKKIEYIKHDTGIKLENENIGLYIPDIDIENPTEDDGPIIVKAIYVDFSKKDCSISFERLTSHHIPSKVTYMNSKITPNAGPAIRMNYGDERYLASHGKNLKTLKYLELQKQLVQNSKVMEAIKKDENDIKSKTSSTYSIAIKEMKEYARTLNPKDFIIKK